ncbi:MAG: NAD-dependent epimerase/dehydratase family protein [Candidatus Binatia bacterium]
MNVLITGGAGFIGSHVARHCVMLGHDVVVLDDLSGGFLDNLPPSVQFVHGSVTDYELVERLFSDHRFTYVYHLAAYAAEGLSHFIRRFNYENNLLGSMNLINASIKAETVQRFVFTSSIAVYGSGQTPMVEDLDPRPEDPYGIAKYAVELDLQSAQEMFGLQYTIFRPHNVYGENQNIGDPYRNVIGIFMNQIMQGQPMTVFGDGLQTRAFSHVDDVAPVIARCVEVPAAVNEVFNVGADQPYTVGELTHEVAQAFGVKPTIQYLPARQEVVHAFASHAKAAHVLGARGTVSLAEGIARMARWAREKGARKTRNFAGVEVIKNMPPSWKSTLAT